MPSYTVLDYEPLDEEGNIREYLFFVELLDPISGRPIAQQEIIYTAIDISVDNMLSTIIYNMLSALPDIVVDLDWRDKWLYLGGSLLWSPRIYEGEYQSVNVANVGGGIAAALHPLPFLALEAGLEATQDWIVLSQSTGKDVQDLVMEVPLALKVVLKPLDIYLIEPYGGVRYSMSLTGLTKPFLLSWMGGVQIGIKTGPGVITLDPRFWADMDYSVIPGEESKYMRYGLQVGIGYKIGLFSKSVRGRR